MTIELRSCALLLLALVAACDDKDSTQLGPSTDGGAAGSAGAGGAGPGVSGAAGVSGASGSAGQGGQGGSGVDPDAGTVRFSATLEGTRVNVTALDQVTVEACNQSVRLVQRVGDSWEPLLDERPPGFNEQLAAHYLDGVYDSACRLSLGCDVAYCYSLTEGPDTFDAPYLIAREFVKVGERAALTCDAQDAGVELDAGPDAGVRFVPDIQSRAPSGPLGVRIRYHRLANCAGDAITTVVPVE